MKLSGGLTLSPRFCQMCGKEFYPPSADWAYKEGKMKVKYFCSWGCLRQWEKEKDEKEKRAKWE